MKCVTWILLSTALGASVLAAAEKPHRKLTPVPFTDVKVTDAFWAPCLKANRTVTIRHNLGHLERQGSLGGFARLAGRKVEKYRGYMWADSDVYKTIEGILYSLQTHPDPTLEARAEKIITAIIGARAPDGYLMPHIQIAEPKYRHFTHEKNRTCESYSMGHMIESAVAHHQATGRKQYLEAAKRCADLLARVQGGGKLEQISGHPGVELALVKLYRATKDRKYLQLARSYVLNAKSHSSLWSRGKPFLADGQAWGHAVAATYLYCGATDVAALTGDAELLGLIDRKWENVVSKKLYITGGVGQPGPGEAYGAEYDLPNAGAYCETCAACGQAFWNHRMNLLHADAKYADILERVLYNGFLSGVSLDGEKFFYVNPLASSGKHHRQAWFGCACCPTNVVRTLPSIPGYVCATDSDGIYVNLYAASTARVKWKDGAVTLRQQTRYPWDGAIRLTVEPDRPAAFTLALRIPAWSRGETATAGLYRMASVKGAPGASVSINGQPVARLDIRKGYARVTRQWKKGDVIELNLPMPVRRVYSHPKVKGNSGRVAIQRGPIVYCLEGADNGKHLGNLYLPPDAKLAAEHRGDLLGGITVIKGKATIRRDDGDDTPTDCTAVPYYAWDHREAGPMMVWIPEKRDATRPVPKP